MRPSSWRGLPWPCRRPWSTPTIPARLFAQVREKGLLAGACKACSVKLGVAAEVEAAGVPLIGDMSGHPSMASYMEAGWQVITF